MKKFLTPVSIVLVFIFIILAGYFWLSLVGEKSTFSKLKVDYDKLAVNYSSLLSRVDIAENKVIELTGGIKTMISEQGGTIKGFLPNFSTYQDKILVCAEKASSTDMYCDVSNAVSIYELKVPAGKYYISGRELCSAQEMVNGICKNKVSYYSKDANSQSVEKKSIVEVGAGKVVENIDLDKQESKGSLDSR